ncbi:hypothetical protein HAP94_25360, partial [Acidithiobacillus ferrivorans]|nr:hypothetical protein [Acidithiobacillus ferrivorans]
VDTYDAGSLGTGTVWIDPYGVNLLQNGTLTVQAGNLNITNSSNQVGNLNVLTVRNTGSYATNVYLSGVDPISGGLADNAAGNLGFGEFESGGVLYGNATNSSGGSAVNNIPLASLTLGAANSGQISFFDSTVTDSGNLTANDAA